MAKIKPLVISLVGARPQFVKIAPLAKALSSRFRHLIVHSGQHYDRMMSDIFFRELAIPKADYNLAIGSGSHGEMTGRIMIDFEKLLHRKKPDMVFVYGDTNSTLAGALTAAKLNIPVGHIEAGLRSYRPDMPEEINRVLTDHVSRLLFCPTLQAIKNLHGEGIKKGIIHSGDLMYQLLDIYRSKIAGNEDIILRHGLVRNNYLLLTMHRAGNVDDRENLSKLVDLINRLPYQIIFPIHPRTRKNLAQYGLMKKLNKTNMIKLCEPVSYLDNLSLISGAKAVLTDSGGVQKESIFLGTPCLTLRDETEWIETLKLGNHLVGLSEKKIRKILDKPLHHRRKVEYKIRGQKPSELIVSAISKFIKGI